MLLRHRFKKKKKKKKKHKTRIGKFEGGWWPCWVKIPHSQAMLLVGVLWVLPMLALALLFSEGDGLVETGCRFSPEQGHPVERKNKPIRTC